MKVLKFGGSSVANAENINRVISIVQNASKTNRIAVVVSAFGDITNLLYQTGAMAKSGNEAYKNVFIEIEKRHFKTIRELIAIENQSSVIGRAKKMLNQLESILEGIFLINEFSGKTSDKVAGFGELLSSFIIYEAILCKGVDIQLKNSQELIVTDDNNTNALVKFDKTNAKISSFFSDNATQVTILPGFVAKSENGTSTTLGRGGSDYTAAIIAAATNSTIVEIWTDVSGMYTANPKLVKQAFPIAKITYQEAMELSHFGAKVLYPPTIQPTMEKNIPIIIKNTFNPNEAGTLIEKINDTTNPVKGISHIEAMSLLTIEGSGMIGIPGFSRRFFTTLSRENINIALITQASSEHSICIAIQDKYTEKAQSAIEKEFEYDIQRDIVNAVIIEKDIAIVALVGGNMKSHQGISGKMFSALGRNNVNIRAIAQGASERNISAVIAKKDIKKALNVLHASFFENQVRVLNLFVIGVGNVGSKLLMQINRQQAYLLNQLRIKVKVVGLANSKKMNFNEDGLNLDKWQDSLQESTTFAVDGFIEKIKNLNLINSIFIDNTANKNISDLYTTFLKNSIAVVTCNKIACSSEYAHFKNLNRLAQEYDAPFLYETNVGAGLPIIKTLKDLIASGDKIIAIHAVLSGSLNFIFNNFDNQTPFYKIVEQAKNYGYTEPDPRIDLNGVDVIRKMLILTRETGNKIEFEDVQKESFLPISAQKTQSVDKLMEILQKENEHFANLYEKAHNKNCKLKYVASYENGKAKVGLEEIAPDHPFYKIEGKDNIVLFYTERYKEQPLIIKGAGAGADVTASGLFADIIKIGNK